MPKDGIVTVTGKGRHYDEDGRGSSSSGGGRAPLLHSAGPETAQGSAGDQMTLDVEGVVNGGVRGKESLG